MVGWRQAATLVVIALAVLAALTLTGAVTADDGEEAATAPTTLQPTQVVAEIPEGYNQLFPFQWGGGSLYQLKMRLATMGCIANTIWNYDGGEWRGYNQYNVPSTLNADWLAAYGEFVPAGSLFATCFDVCEFSYFEAPRGDRPCRSLVWLRASEQWDGLWNYPIDDSTECTDDFDERVKDHVLPSMPVYPGVCIFRLRTQGGIGGSVNQPIPSWAGGRYPYWPSLIVTYEPPRHPNDEGYGPLLLGAEIHELCHTNQYFHFIEQMQPDRLINTPSGKSVLWRTTKPGRSFIDLVGFTQDEAGDWSLPDAASAWALPDGLAAHFDEYMYGTDEPTELAAELCAMYFADRMGELSWYEWLVVEGHAKDFDPAQYLTDEIVQWIETWVALPVIAGAEAD